MAQSTPLRPAANVDPVTFVFPVTATTTVAVNFYDASDPPVEVVGGSVTLDVSFPTSSFSGPPSDPARFPEAFLVPENPQQIAVGGNVYGVDFVAGRTALTVTPSSVAPPVGATQYRIACSSARVR